MPLKKPRSKAAMIDFLVNHMRYDTGNSCNGRSSYAVNIKATRLNLTREERDRVFEAMDVESCFDESGFSDALRDFDLEHDQSWQIGTNGRSGGYAVLYSGGKKDNGYKSRCTDCGQLNFTEATPENCRCGVCRENSRVNLTKPVYQSFVTIASVDGDADFEDWDTDTLRQRVDLVWEFDLSVEDACQTFLDWAMSVKVEDRTISVSQRIKVAVPRD
jgi:hypothetical protein